MPTLREIWQSYYSALKSWGWILLTISLVLSALGLYDLNKRIKSSTHNNNHQSITIEINLQTGLYSYANQIKSGLIQALRQLKETHSISYNYREFDHEMDGKIDLVKVRVKIKDNSNIDILTGEILRIVDDELVEYSILLQETIDVELDYLNDALNSTWESVKTTMSESTSTLEVTDYEAISVTFQLITNAIRKNLAYAKLVEMNKTDLSIIRKLTSEEVTADFLNSESVNQVLYKLFAFSIVGSLMIVFIINITFTFIREILNDPKH